MAGKKQTAREFLEILYSGDADGALARAVENPKLFNFNSEVVDAFAFWRARCPRSTTSRRPGTTLRKMSTEMR